MIEYRKGQRVDAIVATPEGSPFVVRGSKGGFECSKCHVSVVLAPIGMKILAETQAPILCLPCALPELVKSGEFICPPKAELVQELMGNEN